MHKYFFTVTWQHNSFITWIDLARAFDFRIYFGKTLVAFDFDEKITQNVVQKRNMWCVNMLGNRIC